MLVPAILYKKQIEDVIRQRMYDDSMFYYTGSINLDTCNISIREPGNTHDVFQYAIVDSDKNLVGFLSYYIDWYNMSISRFKLMNLTDKPNYLVIADTLGELGRVLVRYNIHRMEWQMVSGNPIQPAYDKFCEKHNGRKLILKDAFRDRHGKFHDRYIYEILF